jgi:mRNA-degrading endonuclease toxin of MazEF toxin-antitoxin module
VHRGEIWTYRPALPRPGQALLRLILSTDGFNAEPDRPVVIGAQVVDHDPGGLLNVRLGDQGWVSLPTIEAVLRSRLDERVAVASPDQMSAVTTALSAMLDLE